MGRRAWRATVYEVAKNWIQLTTQIFKDMFNGMKIMFM